MNLQRCLPAVAFAALAWGVPAHAGILFNITYDPTVSGRTDFAQIQTAVNYVSNEYASLYSDNVTLNFTIKANNSGLGASLFSNNYVSTNYAAVKAALTADAKSADDASSVAALPAADPTGGNLQWAVPSAEAKALGMLANQALFDGTYTFNGCTQVGVNGCTAGNLLAYTYDPNNRKVAGAYDFVGVTEHEFSELMGRTSQLTNAGFGYLPYDLSRFTANNTRSFAATGNGVYFSVDNGAANLKNYNLGGGDVQDWDLSVATDPFNASTGPNQGHFISPVDIRQMDVIGWDLAVPEPSLFIPAACALAFILLRWHRRPSVAQASACVFTSPLAGNRNRIPDSPA